MRYIYDHCFELTGQNLIAQFFDHSRFRCDGLEQTAIERLMITSRRKGHLIREIRQGDGKRISPKQAERLGLEFSCGILVISSVCYRRREIFNFRFMIWRTHLASMDKGYQYKQ
jgi:hypothetical protein